MFLLNHCVQAVVDLATYFHKAMWNLCILVLKGVRAQVYYQAHQVAVWAEAFQQATFPTQHQEGMQGSRATFQTMEVAAWTSVRLRHIATFAIRNLFDMADVQRLLGCDRKGWDEISLISSRTCGRAWFAKSFRNSCGMFAFCFDECIHSHVVALHEVWTWLFDTPGYTIWLFDIYIYMCVYMYMYIYIYLKTKNALLQYSCLHHARSHKKNGRCRHGQLGFSVYPWESLATLLQDCLVLSECVSPRSCKQLISYRLRIPWMWQTHIAEGTCNDSSSRSLCHQHSAWMIVHGLHSRTLLCLHCSDRFRGSWSGACRTVDTCIILKLHYYTVSFLYFMSAGQSLLADHCTDRWIIICNSSLCFDNYHKYHVNSFLFSANLTE